MDPTQALTDLIGTIRELTDLDPSADHTRLAEDLHTAFGGLDRWLRSGGFLPDQWTTTRPAASDIADDLFTSESTAVQAWIDGIPILCEICRQPIGRAQARWHHTTNPPGHSHRARPAIARHLEPNPDRAISDNEALDAITRILAKPDWSGADDLDRVHELVTATGRDSASTDPGPIEAPTWWYTPGHPAAAITTRDGRCVEAWEDPLGVTYILWTSPTKNQQRFVAAERFEIGNEPDDPADVANHLIATNPLGDTTAP